MQPQESHCRGNNLSRLSTGCKRQAYPEESVEVLSAHRRVLHLLLRKPASSTPATTTGSQGGLQYGRIASEWWFSPGGGAEAANRAQTQVDTGPPVQTTATRLDPPLKLKVSSSKHVRTSAQRRRDRA
jgi:hypothetical protein